MLNKQIAAELGTTEETIKVHRARVMKKCAPAPWLSRCGFPNASIVRVKSGDNSQAEMFHVLGARC